MPFYGQKQFAYKNFTPPRKPPRRGVFSGIINAMQKRRFLSHFRDLFWALGILGSLFNSASLKAAYYDTLPKGVRLVALRQVNTDKIISSFTGNKQEKDYFFKLSLDAKSLENAQDIFKSYLQALKAQSPAAYDALQLGEYEISAEAKVNVQGLGVAYGWTNSLTTYISVPYYNANVNLNMVRTKGNNNAEVQRLLIASNNDPSTISTVSSIIMGVANSLPDASGGVIQSVVVNYFDYKPIGNWQGEGLGDVELVGVYRLTDWADAGLATTWGIVLPTGRIDDPDIIQDIAFGDGQFDIYGEIGGGFRAGMTTFFTDSSLRYTFQAPTNKVLRVPESADYPLGSQKATFYEKLGDKVDFMLTETYRWNDMFTTGVGYLYNYTFKSKYDSSFSNANSILENNTEKESHVMKGEIGFTTVELYKKNKFAVPLSINVSAQKFIEGRNIPNYTRFDFEFRLYF